MKAEQEREKQKNLAKAMFKARCNPMADPGYEPKSSEHMDKIVAVSEISRLWLLVKRNLTLIQIFTRIWNIIIVYFKQNIENINWV